MTTRSLYRRQTADIALNHNKTSAVFEGKVLVQWRGGRTARNSKWECVLAVLMGDGLSLVGEEEELVDLKHKIKLVTQAQSIMQIELPRQTIAELDLELKNIYSASASDKDKDKKVQLECIGLEIVMLEGKTLAIAVPASKRNELNRWTSALGKVFVNYF
jgi:hypothetical protein